MIATFLDIVRENQPQNGTEFCIRFLKDAYNTTTTSDVEHIPPPAWQGNPINLYQFYNPATLLKQNIDNFAEKETKQKVTPFMVLHY